MNRDELTYAEAKQMMHASRGAVVEMVDLAFEHGDLSQKERDILYRRHVDWNSLENVGREFGVTRERIRQIEAKAEEKMRCLTKNPRRDILQADKNDSRHENKFVADISA